MTANEVWKEIPNYEGLYAISNLGNIKRLAHKRCDRNQLMKEKHLKVTYPKNNKYPYVTLCKHGICKSQLLHRLMAMAFIPNPNNYPCINHIDGNKQNNSLVNLEWCTYSHNNKEACRLGLNKGTSKVVYQYDLKGNFIKAWKSGRLAEQSLGIKHVADCCNGKRSQSGNFKWSYLFEIR